VIVGEPKPTSPAEPPDRSGAANSNDLPRVGVLIVDDDDDAREILADLVRRAGYTAATARDGVEAIDRLEHMRPELLLLDVVMPRMDGATFRQQQRRHRDWITIPTIVMTGVAEEPTLDVAVEDALRKPISAAVLLEIVARHCSKY
jgi:chemosensory pili system protein ChpA (sensor histidine kinase/response regulator)